MNTSKLKIFATEARAKLVQGVKQRIRELHFDPDTGTADTMPQPFEGGAVFGGDTVSEDFYNKWMSLYRSVQSRGIASVIEEAAYTWFNRLMAIQIMAKQEFISPVLDFESDSVRIPLLVAEARQGRMPRMSDADFGRINELLNDDSRTADQFALLIVAFCHSNQIINRCFGAIADYTELLLPRDIIADGGFVDMINHSTFITDEQYQSAELIGWLYQFYISDRKDEAFAKSGRYTPDDIAPATQIFTPNWIVKYMVQNTVGRICLYSRLADNELIESWKYLVEDTPVHQPMVTIVMDAYHCELEQLKVADLACGSGHILNECFDMLYKIYISNGYTRRNAVKRIFAKNLLGIDLDNRAKQLATFSLLMKACRCDRAFLDAQVMPRVYDMPRPVTEAVPDFFSGDLDDDNNVKEQVQALIHNFMMGATDVMRQELADALMLMRHADTLGSIMRFDLSETTRNALMVRVDEYRQMLASGQRLPEPIYAVLPHMSIILALTDKYSAICMNPPYMGSGRFDAVLSKYVKDNYSEAKADLFAVFMQVAIDRLADKGKYGMINMHSWMFLSSFESLRKTVLETQNIDSLLHLGARTFDELSGEVVQNAAFVISKRKPTYTGHFSSDDPNIPSCQAICSRTADYFRLVDGRDCADKERMFLDALANHTKGIYFSEVAQSNFEKIPGSPIGYWVSKNLIIAIDKSESITSQVYAILKGAFTGDNKRFLRMWHEISNNKIGYRWKKYAKAGGNLRWYGLANYLIDWNNDGYELKHFKGAGIGPVKYFGKPHIVWTKISTSDICFRDEDSEVWYDDASPAIVFDDNSITKEYLIGLLNTKVCAYILNVVNPTLNYQVGDIKAIPIIYDKDISNIVESNSKDNILISRQNWDAHETSWDFKGNEIVEVAHGSDKIHDLLVACISSWFDKFQKLHTNEEELNRQFIELYGLQDELTPDVPLDEVTILQQGEITIEPFAGDTFPQEPLPGHHNRFENPTTIRFATCPQIVWHLDMFIKQFISYAVGCMMGRYSIDKPGLVLANQGDGIEQYNELVPGSRFDADDDGIIPLMPSDTWFSDNATLRFKRFVETVFGSATLNENLNFIEQALGKSIDAYFVKDFWKDHKKMYQNRPIYWLFSSKKGAFQCVAYMHRMDAYTAERIRSKYLLPHIEWLVGKAQELEDAPTLTTPERKQLDSLRKQIAECREYHDRLHVVADRQIAFDLDDGVLNNYAKFGDILAKLR